MFVETTQILVFLGPGEFTAPIIALDQIQPAWVANWYYLHA
jgi:hypothetical protein